jgi:hypothetical protein
MNKKLRAIQDGLSVIRTIDEHIKNPDIICINDIFEYIIEFYKEFSPEDNMLDYLIITSRREILNKCEEQMKKYINQKNDKI